MQSCTGAEKRVKRPDEKGESSAEARRKGDKRTAGEGSERARLFDTDWLLAWLGCSRLAPPRRAPDHAAALATDAETTAAMRRWRGIERLLARSCADRWRSAHSL
ncbi:hypothetical protein OPT61_g1997 [Boeremia exigua]|uniref:Uncharacterized protein n=1 Tax=Boeremia exigua TaxID=749465 RepID=A0ACC2INJ7_9PLEO|nr:hypothetical protein OPT61_g1997 [Boeremia exigua]